MTQTDVVEKNGGREWKIDSDTVAFLFSVHQWGNLRVADKREIESNADKTMLHLSKHLIDSKEYKAIGRFLYETKAWVIARSVPSFFREGCYLFRLSMVEEVERELTERKSKLRELINTLIDVYPQQIAEGELRLGPQFKRSDYPTIEELRASFYWETQWISFRVPEDLPEQIRKIELEKAENMWRSAAENITFALRESFKELISHAADKLRPSDDGKMKIFRDSTIENIFQFLETFNDRNITSDSELAELVKRAGNVLASVDNAQLLRDNKQVRDEVRNGFERITRDIDALLVDKPIRKFNLDD